MSKRFHEGVSPVGRIISHSIFNPSDVGYLGKKLESPIYFIQLAILKTDLGLSRMFENMRNAAEEGFPAGESQSPQFFWKFKDGDAPEHKGREGWGGCYVFTFRTGFTPSAIVDVDFNQILDPGRVRPGYQARVEYSVKANGDSGKPGIYLNFRMVQLVSVDAEISSGPSASEVFQDPAKANPMQPMQPPVPGPPAPANQMQPMQPPVPDYQFVQGPGVEGLGQSN